VVIHFTNKKRKPIFEEEGEISFRCCFVSVRLFSVCVCVFFFFVDEKTTFLDKKPGFLGLFQMIL